MNYLTRALSTQGTEISEHLPLQVDDVTQASDRISVPTETVTFDSATAANSRGVVSLDKAPILGFTGDGVGSFWDQKKNRVYEVANSDQIGTLTETATSATVIITDLSKNLDQFFDTPSATLRYVLKATDTSGGVLYGYIGAIATSSSQYTIDIYDTAAMATQSWVGTLADFDGTATRIEIFRNTTSLAWVTGTILLREKALNELLTEEAIFDNLDTAGDYAINYRTGAIYYRKATTGTSDTLTYDTMASSSVTVSASGVATNATEDSAVIAVGPQVMFESKVMDGSALPNQTNESDAARPAVTLAGVPFAFPTNLEGTGTPAIDHSVVIQNGLGLTTFMQGLEAKDFDGSALPNSVTEGDAVRGSATLSGVPFAFLVNEDGSWSPMDSASQALKIIEQSPIYTNNIGDTLADVTNETSSPTTTYYYWDMTGYTGWALQADTGGTAPTDTLTITVEASNQDDGTAQASVSYDDMTTEFFGVVSWVDVDFFIIQDNPFQPKFWRVKTVTAGAGDDQDYTLYLRRW